MLRKIIRNEFFKERLFLILFISLLIIIWFRKGLIVGSGESGLPFYNSSKLLELTSNSWTDVPLGTSAAIGSASYPFYLAITFLQSIGIPAFVLQAFMYWILFVVGTLSVHKIASTISDHSTLTRLSSSLFYIFNPVVHISVLHRLQYPLIFFYGFMPLAFLIYLIGLQSRKFIYLIVLGLCSVIFSFAFIGIESVEMLFAVLGFLSLICFLATSQKEKDWFPLFYFIIFVIIFISINAWWLTPLLLSVTDIGKSGIVKYYDAAANVETFKGISDSIGSVLSIFRLFKPVDYPKDESLWAWVYGTAPFIILSFFSIIAFIIGLFKRHKELLYKFLILASFITMFWTKGSLPPFGGISLFLFQRFSVLQIFRNPLEKSGLLLPLVMAIPVGFGISMITGALAKKFNLPKAVVAFVILTLFFPVYMFPITTGLAFTGGPPPANNMNIGQYVKVPDYYKDAREWLDKQQGLFRVLTLPIDGEGMTYKWDYGFSGVELSNNLFNQSMISIKTSQAFLPDIISNIKKTLKVYPEKLDVLARILNVKYIMLRDDIDYLAREIEAPLTDLNLIQENLNNQFFPVVDFGKLKFFEFKPTEFQPRISAGVSPIYLFDPKGRSIDLMPFSNPSDHDLFITNLELPTKTSYEQFAKKIVINGLKVENIDINVNDPVESLPYVSVYRGTPFYALVRLKEEIQSQFQSPKNQLAFKVNILGKRLVEIDHSAQDPQAIDEYFQLLQPIGQELQKSDSVDRAIVENLLYQRQALEGVEQKTNYKDKINEIKSFLDNLFVNIGVRSVYPTQKTQISRFFVPKDSEYEVLVSQENWYHYFQDQGIGEFDLDGKTMKPDLSRQKIDKGIFSLGIYMLSRGVHEVSIASPKAVNLIAEKLPEELALSSQNKQPLVKTIPITNLDNDYTYVIYFEYLEEKGNVPVVAIYTDVDSTDKNGEIIPRFGIGLTRSNYDFGWKSYSGKFIVPPNAQKYEIAIKILPFGDCKAVVERPYRRYCEDNRFNQRFLQDSSSRIRNLRLEKIFTNQVMLREVEPTIVQGSSPEISFDKISPARYKVKVTNSKNPFFLVLSTTFDPRWNAYVTTHHPQNIMELLSGGIQGDMVSSDNHFVANGYANGWYIEKLGNFEMFLEYSPENAFVIGREFSAAVIIILLLIVLIYIRGYIISTKRFKN